MIGAVHPSVRITNAPPNARHRDGGGCSLLVLAPVAAGLATLLFTRKRNPR
jgi:hypothetical protein